MNFYISTNYFSLFLCTVSASGDAHENLHSPLAGIRSRIDSSACGNAITILHPRKRRFCNYFCAPSPRAEMHMKIYISPSREYDPESTVPLAGMQLKFYIPASGDFVIISVHRPLERRCTDMKIYISPSWEYDPESTVPLAGMQSKFYISASGDFVIIYVHGPRERRCTCKFTFPTRGNTIQRRQFRLRECNKNIASPRADIL